MSTKDIWQIVLTAALTAIVSAFVLDKYEKAKLRRNEGT